LALILLLCACQKRSAQNLESPEPTSLLTSGNVACIRQAEGCVLCVGPRPLVEVEERTSHICNPRQPSQCVDFCTALAAECATPWRRGPSCIAKNEDEFRRQEFWLEASDRPVAEIVGRAVDAESRKLEGARVELADGPTVLAEAMTGKDGDFRIVLRTGTFLVRISHPGQATLLDTVRLGPEKGGPQLRVFRLSPEQRLSGRIIDELDRPVAQAQVIAIQKPSDPLSSSETQTAADGSFQLRGLDVRRYTLRVVAFGYQLQDSPRVQSPAKGLVVRVARTHIVRGTILDASEQPLAQAKILVVAIGASESAAVSVWTSGADGRYAIPDLAPGGYLMWAQKGDKATYPPMRVTLEADDLEPLDVDLKLDHEGSLVTGKVQDEDGRALAGAHVDMVPKWPLAVPQTQSAETSRDGKFAVDGLTPGRYEISVRLGLRALPLWAGPRDVQVPIEQGEEVTLDEPIRVRRRLD
jgi:protocatechuate 3,4-dioxygenase beta subunit